MTIEEQEAAVKKFFPQRGLEGAVGNDYQEGIDAKEAILSSLRELKELREAGNDIVSLLGDSGFMDVSRDLSCSKWLAVYAKLKAALAAVPHQEPPRV